MRGRNVSLVQPRRVWVLPQGGARWGAVFVGGILLAFPFLSETLDLAYRASSPARPSLPWRPAA